MSTSFIDDLLAILSTTSYKKVGLYIPFVTVEYLLFGFCDTFNIFSMISSTNCK